MDAPTCYCGSPTEYKDSAQYYHGRSHGKRWICSRWPHCLGSVGAHPDGRPLGTVPDPETKKLRMQIHDIIDPLWRDKSETDTRSKNHRRGSVYRWIRDITGFSIEECHVGMWNAQQCRFVLERIASIPYDKRKELLPRAEKRYQQIGEGIYLGKAEA